MSETIIPSSAKKIVKPGKNQNWLEPIAANKTVEKMTKHASMKHENPEYFKRQAEQKSADRVGFPGRARSRPY